MIKTSKKTENCINMILITFGIVWITPICFVLFNLFKTKQEYNLGSLWELPESFNMEIISTFANYCGGPHLRSFLPFEWNRTKNRNCLTSAISEWPGYGRKTHIAPGVRLAP